MKLTASIAQYILRIRRRNDAGWRRAENVVVLTIAQAGAYVLGSGNNDDNRGRGWDSMNWLGDDHARARWIRHDSGVGAFQMFLLVRHSWRAKRRRKPGGLRHIT